MTKPGAEPREVREARLAVLKDRRERLRWWDRHPRLTMILLNVVFVLLLLGGAETFLRFYLPYNAGYYMAFEAKPGVQHFPYGIIKYNSLGFPDDEFDLASTKPRIGYFGDSVTRGVGVGSGYRISDLLEQAYPAYEHWTFGTVRDGVDERGAQKILELIKIYHLTTVVYLLNLNDILLSNRFAERNTEPWIARIKARLMWLDRFRGESYLYTVIRSQVRLFLAAHGYGHDGWKAAELFPIENEEAVQDTAERVSKLAQELDRRGVAFVAILLPYEMQVSAEAARKYWELGIRWDEDFLSGLTQKMLIEDFAGRVKYFDARQAFLPDGAKSLKQNKLGEYFVYNRGDKLDWNHPNREGDRRIAVWLTQRGIFGTPSSNGIATKALGAALIAPRS